jgi:hypothetical protein
MAVSLSACGNADIPEVPEVTDEPEVTTTPPIITTAEPEINELKDTPASDFEWKIVDGGVEIIRYKGWASDVRIPSEIEGYPVTVIRGSYNPDGNTHIYGGFSGTYVKHVHIPDSVIIIGGWSFDRISTLQSVTIGNNVKHIESGAFNGCTALNNVVLPDGLLTIGSSAFSGCDSLTSIVIPDSVVEIGYRAFSSSNGLTSVTLGSGISSIESGTFQRCRSLASVIIPGNVKVIRNSAFAECENLTSLIIEEGVELINTYAFLNCKALTSVHIPDSVTRVGENVFLGCENLTNLTYRERTFSIEKRTHGWWMQDEFYEFVNSFFIADLEVLDAEALKYLGYIMHDGGRIIPLNNWTDTLTPNEYRKYFFGTWERVDKVADDEWEAWRNMVIFDDTIDNRLNKRGFLDGFFNTEAGAIVQSLGTPANEGGMFWVAFDNPNTLYYIHAPVSNAWLSKESDPLCLTALHANTIVYTRTDMLIAEPDDNYLSWLRLLEISMDYNISLNMLTDIEIEIENQKYMRHYWGFWSQPVFLISEAPDKLVLRTTAKTGMLDDEIELIYTIEKINGEWVRTVK